MRDIWPDAHRLPDRPVRYEIDGARIISPQELRALFDVLEVRFDGLFVEYQERLLFLRLGPHACALSLSAPDQPNGAEAGILHISVSRGRLGGKILQPDPAVERRFLDLVEAWPGETVREAPTAGPSYIANHFTRDVGERFVRRLMLGVELWEAQAALRRPVRAWAAFDPVAEAVRCPATMRALARWAAAEDDDIDALGAVTALVTDKPAPIIALEPGLLDALIRTDPPKKQRPPFRTFAIDMLREVEGARVLVAVSSAVADVLSVFALPADWPRSPEVQCTELHAALVMNVCAFMANVDRGETRTNAGELAELQAQAERRRGKKRKKALQRLSETPAITTVRLGGRRLAPGGHGGAGGDGGRREHWVRGHWREQVYGPRSIPLEDRPRRLRYIEPHRRCEGSPAGVVQGQTYVLQRPEAS